MQAFMTFQNKRGNFVVVLAVHFAQCTCGEKCTLSQKNHLSPTAVSVCPIQTNVVCFFMQTHKHNHHKISYDISFEQKYALDFCVNG